MAAPREFMALWQSQCPDLDFNIADPPFCGLDSLRWVLYDHWRVSRRRYLLELQEYRVAFQRGYARYEKEA